MGNRGKQRGDREEGNDKQPINLSTRETNDVNGLSEDTRKKRLIYPDLVASPAHPIG
jgi:hypothetical protein